MSTNNDYKIKDERHEGGILHSRDKKLRMKPASFDKTKDHFRKEIEEIRIKRNRALDKYNELTSSEEITDLKWSKAYRLEQRIINLNVRLRKIQQDYKKFLNIYRNAIRIPENGVNSAREIGDNGSDENSKDSLENETINAAEISENIKEAFDLANRSKNGEDVSNDITPEDVAKAVNNYDPASEFKIASDADLTNNSSDENDKGFKPATDADLTNGSSDEDDKGFKPATDADLSGEDLNNSADYTNDGSYHYGAKDLGAGRFDYFGSDEIPINLENTPNGASETSREEVVVAPERPESNLTELFNTSSIIPDAETKVINENQEEAKTVPEQANDEDENNQLFQLVEENNSGISEENDEKDNSDSIEGLMAEYARLGIEVEAAKTARAEAQNEVSEAKKAAEDSEENLTDRIGAVREQIEALQAAKAAYLEEQQKAKKDADEYWAMAQAYTDRAIRLDEMLKNPDSNTDTDTNESSKGGK